MALKNPKNIIILGAGSTGEYLAEELSAEHNIVLIDKDINKINQIKNKSKMDLLTIAGDAADLSIFNEIDLKDINFFTIAPPMPPVAPVINIFLSLRFIIYFLYIINFIDTLSCYFITSSFY